MSMLLRLAFREIRHSLRAAAGVVFILFIGFVGPLATSALKSSVDRYLRERSREILSADLTVSALRPFEADERLRIREAIAPVKMAEATEFVTMARAGDVTTLVEVKGVDSNFPIFGAFRLLAETTAIVSRDATSLEQERIAWASPEALAQLGLKVGDTVTLGTTGFKIAARVEDAPGLGRGGLEFAPSLYIGRRFVAETGLTQFGSQVFYRLYLQLSSGQISSGQTPDLSSEVASARVKNALQDPDIFLRTPDDSIQGFERFFRFFNLYLVVITLIVFALAWTSAFYILQVFIQDRLKNAAILLTLGASRSFVAVLYALQIASVMGVALAMAAVVVEGIAWIVPWVGSERLPPGFVFALSARDLLSMGAVAMASATAFAFPLVAKLWRVRLQALLAEDVLVVVRGRWSEGLIHYGPMVAILLALSAWLMDSTRHAFALVGGLFASALVSWFLGRLVFRAMLAAVRARPGVVRLVAIHLVRSRYGTNLCFLTLVLVATVLNLVPHLLESMTHEMRPLQNKEAPALFLFNIPETSVEALREFSGRRGARLEFVTPMILARLLRVNGESTMNDQFQRFPVRISYRGKPIPSEKIVEGREFDGPYDPSRGDRPGLSVEERFAERNDLKLGDVLEFDVQGVPLEGRIQNLRTVKWTDFNPNFFMIFQPGVLEEAPKTYLANVKISGPEKARFQNELIRGFPDLSVIDIGRTIERVLEVVLSVVAPARLAAWLAVVMSFVILVGVIAHNLRLRAPEIDIEKMLGAEAYRIRRMLVAEYAAIAVVACGMGSAAAIAMAAMVTGWILDIPLRVSWPALGGAGVVTVGVTSAIAFISCTRVLSLRGASRKL